MSPQLDDLLMELMESCDKEEYLDYTPRKGSAILADIHAWVASREQKVRRETLEWAFLNPAYNYEDLDDYQNRASGDSRRRPVGP